MGGKGPGSADYHDFFDSGPYGDGPPMNEDIARRRIALKKAIEKKRKKEAQDAERLFKYFDVKKMIVDGVIRFDCRYFVKNRNSKYLQKYRLNERE